jgi:hypothetical protein
MRAKGLTVISQEKSIEQQPIKQEDAAQ